MPGLADFAGIWQLQRRIEEAAGPGGRLDGVARFDAACGGLEYAEQGTLRLGEALGEAVAVQATRRYLWRAAGGMIAVFFADGRVFHEFDPQAPDVAACHDCAPDRYLVRYDFSLWPRWSSEWRVTGPRKDYRMRSDYRPAG